MTMDDRIAPQTLVEGPDGRRGVTCPDLMACCPSGTTPVVWDGEDAFEGTETGTLKVLGPERAQPDARRCGAGLGQDCCIFLTLGADGFCCERFGSLRHTLMFRKETMSAKRQPTALFPACFLPEAESSR